MKRNLAKAFDVDLNLQPTALVRVAEMLQYFYTPLRVVVADTECGAAEDSSFSLWMSLSLSDRFLIRYFFPTGKSWNPYLHPVQRHRKPLPQCPD